MFFINYRPMHRPSVADKDQKQIALCTVYLQEQKIIADGLFSFDFIDSEPEKIDCIMIEENPMRLDDIIDAEQIELFDSIVTEKSYYFTQSPSQRLLLLITKNASTISEQYAHH